MMIRRFLRGVFKNTRCSFVPSLISYKDIIIKRRLNEIEIVLYFNQWQLSKKKEQILFLSAFTEKIIEEMTACNVKIYTLTYANNSFLHIQRKRKYELGAEWSPASV